MPDLAVANKFSNNVSVWLGMGNGTFGTAEHYAAGDGSTSVVISDLDGDAVPDLVVANEFLDNVSVLLGLGDGSFAARVNYAAGDAPRAVAVGDLNGDLVVDLAVANSRSDNISVLLGVCDGTFEGAVDFAVGKWPESLAIGDLDGDQVPDLAAVNWVSHNVSVLRGVGDGTFVAAVHHAADARPVSIAIADLDGNQKLDLAVANWHGPNVSVLLDLFPRDCNGNDITDVCDIDCGSAGGPCDLSGCGLSEDCNGNALPDECELDCNDNGVPDECDLASGDSADCNCNEVADECEISIFTVVDCTDVSGSCDEGPFFCASDCEPDVNTNGIPDCCDADIGPSSCPDCCVMADDLVEVFFTGTDSRCTDDQPNNCAIDAREPHDIRDAAARKGWDRMVMSFSCNPARISMVPGDFTVSVVPAGAAPGVSSVVIDSAFNTATVMLDDRIAPRQWMCIAHRGSGNQWCMGYLPADASQDGLSTVSDISALIDAINLVPGLELASYATDINRSGVTSGQDILRLIDLLNGAGEFDPWITQGLPLCPSVGNAR